MKTIVEIAIGVGIVAVGAIIYAMSKKKVPVLEETVDGDLRLEDVVAYFKTLSMVKGKQVPFIALPDVKKLGVKVTPRKAKTLILGVYNTDNDVLNPMKVVYADGFDEKLIEVLGDEKLVVLN